MLYQSRRRLMNCVWLNIGMAICLLIFTTAFLRDTTSLVGVQAVEARRVSEIRINSGPFDDNQSPSIGVLTDGRFIVGWHEGVPTTCLGRAFSREGSPVAGPFILNPFTGSAWKYGPALAPLPDGGFATFWGHSFGVRGQRFDKNLNPIGGDFLFANIGEAWPVMTALANGDIVVAGDHISPPYPIIAKRYNSSLAPYGPETQANVNPPGIRLFTSAIAGAPNGNYTVAWFNASGDIIARSFNPSGAPLGGEFKVNSSTGGTRSQPGLVYNSRNELVVVWHGKGDGDSDGVYARRFRPDNTPIGAEWQVNQTPAGSQYYANIAVGGNDEIVISWTSANANESDVFARLYGADLTPIGAEFRVNQFTSGGQRTPVFGGRRGNAIIGNQLVFTWTGSGQQGVGVYLTTFSVSDIAQPATCISSPAGLVSRWPGNGNANDIIGGNQGSLQNGVAFASGLVGQAFNFDGVDDYVNVPHAASLNPSLMTVDAWFHATDISRQIIPPVVKKAGEGVAQQNGYALEINNNIDGTVRFWVFISGSWYSASSSSSVLTNTWYHIAGTYDGSAIKLYLNGELRESKSVAGTFQPSQNPLRIGADPANPGRYFKGLIDEVEIFNRALSASEIQAIFTAGRFGGCKFVNVSAASYREPPLAGESIVSSFGVNLATATQPALSQPLPTTLAGTTVKVYDGLAVERLAPLFFVSPTQINYQIPPGMVNGAASIVITSGSGVISYGAAQIESVAPGLFSANADGQGVAAAVVFRRKANGMESFELVARFDPAQGRFVAVPIDLGPETDQVFLILYGTGFRNRSALSAVSTTIGGMNSETRFAGAAPGFVGLDQANVHLLRSLIGRGEVDVVLTAEAKPANTVRVNIR